MLRMFSGMEALKISISARDFSSALPPLAATAGYRDRIAPKSSRESMVCELISALVC